MSSIDVTNFLSNHSIEETIEVLDDLLLILVINTEYQGLSDRLVHQYLLIRGLRDLFARI